MATDNDEFCGGSPFWNESLLMDGSYPQFTECFMTTALVWGPCGLLWLALPGYWFYITNLAARSPIPLNKLSITKTILCLVLCAVTLVQLVHHVTEDQDFFPAVYVADAVKMVTFVLAAVIVQIERRFSRINSPPLFLFWLLMMVCNVVPLYTYVEKEVYESDSLEFSMHCLLFGALTIQLLVFSFADKRERHGYLEMSQRASLELTASFPSILTNWWVNGTIQSGFKKALTEDDINDLHPDDVCEVQVPRFAKAWQAEVNRVNAYNEKYLAENPEARSLYSSMDHRVSLQNRDRKEKMLHRRRPFEPNEKTKLLKGQAKKEEKDKTENKSPLKEANVIRALFMTYGFELVSLQILKTCFDLIAFVGPKITEAILDFIDRPKGDHEMWKGYVLGMSYFVVNTFSSLMSNQILLRNKRLGMHMKSALVAAIYKKSLTMTNEAKKETTLGEIVNLMSIDCQRVESILNFLYILFSTPFQIAIALYMLFDQIGVAVFAGVGVIVLLMPLNTFVGVFLRQYNREVMKVKDKRIRLMNEVLNGMKVLKLYAWEDAFQDKVGILRSNEIKIILKTTLFMASLSLIFQTVPYFVQVASFGVFLITDDYLDPSKAFVSISLFGQLMSSLNMMPFVLPLIIQVMVSINRIRNFLRQPDIDPDVQIKDSKAENAVKVEKGTFTWDKDLAVPTLRNISLEVKPGSLVAVVGSVGSGKSSLLSAIMGEMNKVSGSVTVKSSMAYVPQEAWIQNATLRDNILFTSDYKPALYDKVVEACALKSDLEILPGGDQTEIGEKGINISGGQKQRVSLARAVYSRADIYLLDDPLSAVDSHVGKHIFHKVIGRQGVLRDKTRILVTHGVHWLPMVDKIVVLRDGEVTEVGSYEELVSHDGDFAQFLKEFFVTNESSEDEAEENGDPEIAEMKKQVLQRLESVTGGVTSGEESSKLSHSLHRRVSLSRSISHKGKARRESKAAPTEKKMGLKPPRVGQKLIEEERAETGTVGRKVYWKYIKAIGPLSFSLSLVLYACYMGVTVYSSIWLSMWTDDQYLANTSLIGTEEYTDRTNLYIGLYAGLGVLQGLFSYTFAASALWRLVSASGTLHNVMLSHVLQAPMSFFDTTPIGRIINRFSRDVDVLDSTLPNTLRQFIRSGGMVLIAIINIAYSTPIVLSVIVPVVILYALIQRVYMPASRQIRRIDSTTRSPIYVHFSETLSGAASIRAYGAQQRFMDHSETLVDYNFKFYFASIATANWLQVRLEFLGNLVILAAAIFAVSDSSLSAGLAGLSVSYATQVTSSLSFLIQVATQAETNIVSVERIVEYTETNTEAAWYNPDNRPAPEWPEEGNLEFDDLQIRYRPGLELVLKGVSCQLKPGEKVGIVGRTGAGKSSLTVALFRLVEAAAGKIVLDSHNIAGLGLHDLRSRITILPQDPVIFSGTIRMNLDPSELHMDSEVWEALEHAHLKDFVNGLAGQLDYNCGEGGQNLSMGQRQLLCLARTLLRRSRVLVLDEATAAVDMETDELIQRTIREEFNHSTVLTIAHRLNTIMDYDRVIVMDKGLIKEMDSPNALLSNTDSVFYSMAKDANLV
ncbi:multidrug resistance-associated protein 1 [Aplysia californica]|uniref:ABC-type glutathione-S-conjugate transporter n=1 Tax=Aplysia californica TaxID=6500 RepID=A0ABM1W5D6_APLCA|nr:multidrug resistance-associated protein 1 [Aplysia californica]